MSTATAAAAATTTNNTMSDSNTATAASKISSNNNSTSTSSRRAKDLFGDCALVEIIHLHDCFRGALRALEVDVSELCREITSTCATATATSPALGVFASASTMATAPAASSGGHDAGDDARKGLDKPTATATATSSNNAVVAASSGKTASSAGPSNNSPKISVCNNNNNGIVNSIHNSSNENKITDLERRVAGRFTVIWSVFRAHSAAEDEFIWPALKAKQVALPGDCGSHCGSHHDDDDDDDDVGASRRDSDVIGGSDDRAVQGVGVNHNHNNNNNNHHGGVEAANNRNVGEHPQQQQQQQQQEQARDRAHSITVHCIEQEEYEEDHADEERMFNSINDLLSNLRDELSQRRKEVDSKEHNGSSSSSSSSSLQRVALMLLEGTGNLMRHLMAHLEKEESHCMPLVAQYLTKVEINDLVGKIMGKRSSELMSQILTMAVQNLNETDRDDMVHYMKQAMVGTFFERWLKMGGWINSAAAGGDKSAEDGNDDEDDDGGGKMSANTDKDDVKVTSVAAPIAESVGVDNLKDETNDVKVGSVAGISEEPGSNLPVLNATNVPPKDKAINSTCKASSILYGTTINEPTNTNEEETEKYTSAAELEKLIRAIGTNPNLDIKQKNLTIQGLRDSVWKSNCRLSKRKREEWEDGAMVLDQPPAQMAHVATTVSIAATSNVARAQPETVAMQQTHHMSFSGARAASVGTRFKRETPPSSYFKKTKEGEVKLVWSSDPHSANFHPNDGSVPLFSASELAPTYHDGGINHVLGCPHYARSCKLRHPSSGRLYTCRLCCEQNREMATKDKDSPLDRYAVTECLCMICGALQPAGDKCVNPECESRGKPYARYTCNICNFHDDSPNKSVYHCPFCNVCRSGQGLGIDYRHCMRCNACVSLKDEHHCIPQRLQGNCPICHETMFESTEPLRGLKCGHVMHLSCFTMYMRGFNYTCPLCKKSAEDMKEYFGLLDSAVRMQPMPPAYAATTSNIYCQDCGKMGNVGYHFVGLKCHHCGSYNTRELQRVDANVMASLWQGY